MCTLEELRSQFEALNITVNAAVLEKCVELCATFTLEPEDFIDQWLAYAASNLNGGPPSLEALDQMERKELKKQSRSVINTPKTNRMEVDTTPIAKTPVRQEIYEESPVVSQVGDRNFRNVPSEDFAKRSDAGTILQTWGECKCDTFKKRASGAVCIKITNQEIGGKLYMYEKFLSKQATLNGISRWVITDILQYNKLVLTQENLKHFSGEMVICGRIFSDTRGKLDPASVQLEGFLDFYRGQRIKLNLNTVEKSALFCGQSVVLSGHNRQDSFLVKEIYMGAPLALPEKPISLNETFQIMVASGPYTVQENLLYQPLEIFLKKVLEFKPNLLIIMGPFLDRNHPHLQDIGESFDSFFERMVDGILQELQETGIQVILVPSDKDIHNHVVFPSLPFALKKKYDNLYLAPNPFILDIDGLIIGGSSTDILFHLSKVECNKGIQGDRISRMVSHLFSQRSLYPLHPPDSDVRVDFHLLEKFGMFETAPHILILPSSFRYFMKNVENSVVINPERLVKGNSAGTYARIEVGAAPPQEKLSGRIGCQIYRI